MSQLICPICGKFASVRYFDPSGFEEDILLVQVRGLGRGKGVEVVEKYSLLDGSDPDLLELISDRVAVLYNMLYDDVDDEDEELLDDINAALAPYYDEDFDNIRDAAKAILDQYLDYDKEENNDLPVETIDTEDFESLSEIDKELWIADHEEDDDDKEEDISDLHEDIIE